VRVDLAAQLNPEPKWLIQLRMQREQLGDQAGDATDDGVHVSGGIWPFQASAPSLSTGIGQEQAVHIDEDARERIRADPDPHGVVPVQIVRQGPGRAIRLSGWSTLQWHAHLVRGIYGK
jgi:hypothetical protein